MKISKRKALKISTRVMCEQKEEMNVLSKEIYLLEKETQKLFISKKGGMDYEARELYEQSMNKLEELKDSYGNIKSVFYTKMSAMIDILMNLNEEELKTDFPQLYEYAITQDKYEEDCEKEEFEKQRLIVKDFFRNEAN